MGAINHCHIYCALTGQLTGLLVMIRAGKAMVYQLLPMYMEDILNQQAMDYLIIGIRLTLEEKVLALQKEILSPIIMTTTRKRQLSGTMTMHWVLHALMYM